MKGYLRKLVYIGLLPTFASTADASVPVVKVAEVASDKSCSLYGVYWGEWLVLECQRNFPQMRERIQSAIAEGGKVVLSSLRGGHDAPSPDLVVTGRVGALGMTKSSTSANDYCIGKSTVAASMDVRVRNARTGTIVYAATVTKTVEVGSDIEAGSSDCSTNTPAETSYLTVQRELALAVSRAINFQLEPLRVSAIDGNRVLLNYGAPLLSLGTVVQLTGASGFPTRFKVVASTDRTATAIPFGQLGNPVVGSVGSVIESDDPAANARRTDRVELP